MAAQGKKTTVQAAEELVLPILQELGLKLWDTRFEKEGSSWYLRYFIDKEGGVNIQDCEQVSKAVDILLDEKDFISQSYTLEVCSPGIDRKLSKDHHFKEYIGHDVLVRFIRDVDGERDFIGTLKEKSGDQITVLLDEETEMVFNLDETAYIKLHVDF